MIKILSKSQNTLLADLQAQFDESGKTKVDFLVIAHPDSQMLAKLRKAYQSRSIAVLSIPQGYWALDDDSVAETVQWLFDETSAKGILLVGHSQGGANDSIVEVCPEGEIFPASNNGNRFASLIERMKHACDCVKASERHFISQLNSLQKHAMVKDGRIAEANLVQGVFYRAESGVFCAWDDESRTFRPLVNESVLR